MIFILLPKKLGVVFLKEVAYRDKIILKKEYKNSDFKKSNTYLINLTSDTCVISINSNIFITINN